MTFYVYMTLFTVTSCGPAETSELLTLDPVLLHLLDLGDGLSQVVCELLAVLRVRGVEDDEDLDVSTRDGRREPDAIRVI